jgi:hypothetical protein
MLGFFLKSMENIDDPLKFHCINCPISISIKILVYIAVVIWDGQYRTIDI